jgi:sec-independent protein translocase protein TatB
VFDLSLPKLLVLGVLALLIFGPEQLPKFASQAGRALRELRRLAEGAQADLRENLGPEFSDFDIADLHPKNFVKKHLLDDLNGDPVAASAASAYTPSPYEPSLSPGERPPFDLDAT